MSSTTHSLAERHEGERFMRYAAMIALMILCNALSTRLLAEENVNKPIFDFTLKDIDGNAYPLAKHKGEALLIVNVASRCGFTPQYDGLEKLYEKYHAKGFSIIGVPANEFGAQEPGTNAEIKSFCSTKYDVSFPMMEKAVVKGEG